MKSRRIAGIAIASSIAIFSSLVSFSAKAEFFIPDFCLNPYESDTVNDFARPICEHLIYLQSNPQRTGSQPQQAAPSAPTEINYITLGRDIQAVYENSQATVWPDGARGFIDSNSNIYRITKQVADDGNVLYYMRVNRTFRIMRYNASRDSTGYTDVWSHSMGNNYMKGRVTMMTDGGQYLASPQITDVETNDMYPSFKVLLAF